MFSSGRGAGSDGSLGRDAIQPHRQRYPRLRRDAETADDDDDDDVEVDDLQPLPSVLEKLSSAFPNISQISNPSCR
jgi:hypothetical protein